MNKVMQIGKIFLLIFFIGRSRKVISKTGDIRKDAEINCITRLLKEGSTTFSEKKVRNKTHESGATTQAKVSGRSSAI